MCDGALSMCDGALSSVNVPADGQIPLSGNAHDKKGGPGHQDVLQGIPEVREHVHVRLNKQTKKVQNNTRITRTSGLWFNGWKDENNAFFQ